MKKAITFVLLFVILLLSAVGCTDRKKDPSAGTQPTNSTETNPPDQTDSTTETDPSSSSDTQTAPSAEPPFVTGNDDVDLPIDSFD